MAIILNNSVMVHVPKTGGIWAYAALRDQDRVRGVVWSKDNYPHPYTADVKRMFPGQFTFCFVRDPVTWLRSFWASQFIADGLGYERFRVGRSPWAEFSECQAPTFKMFVWQYLDRFGGAVGRLFDRYTDGCDFVGRQESLREDLLRATKLAGENVNAERLMAREPLNRDIPLGELATLPAEMKAEIRKQEAALLAKYYPA